MELLASLRSVVEDLPPERLPEAIGALAEAQALATLRLHANGAAPEEPQEPVSNRYVTADEVSKMLSVSAKWVYANADRLGVVKLSPRAVRFSERAVRRYILARQQRDRP